MTCPNCKSDNTKVACTMDSRNRIKRYRKCCDCNENFKTIELLVTKEAIVLD